MSKRNIFIGIFSLLAFVILFFPTIARADQYYDQYPGNSFFPEDESFSYFRNCGYSEMYHDDISDADYICPVTFNVPDGSTYFIKSIGIRFRDNNTNGSISVWLRRKNLYTGICHTVATWSSGKEYASPSPQTASKGTEPGVKLVDTKKFAYWFDVFFYVDGTVNPGPSLQFHQIRIHYGT